jgi:hypothetical protein
MKRHSPLPCALALCLLAVLVVPSISEAVTILGVKVTVSSPAKTATYCDTTQIGCSVYVWNLGGGKSLAAGQTLILTQTGLLVGVGGNFDTSDIVTSTPPVIVDCTPANPCTVQIQITTDAGTVNYLNAGPNALNAFNHESEYEAADWVLAQTYPTFTLSLGYADNVHVACQVTARDLDGNCFPQANWTATGATHFLGAPVTIVGPPFPCGSNCYDGGALLLRGTAPPPRLRTVTQGGWGAPPHGQNPGTILNNNFATLPAQYKTIGCAGNSLTFASAQAIRDYLATTGGTPSVLPATSVFAAQVLALSLNVGFSSIGVLPNGLGGAVLFNSGPAAGKTVSQILAEANQVLGGCAVAGTYGYLSISQLNNIVTSINEAFD